MRDRRDSESWRILVFFSLPVRMYSRIYVSKMLIFQTKFACSCSRKTDWYGGPSSRLWNNWYWRRAICKFELSFIYWKLMCSLLVFFLLLIPFSVVIHNIAYICFSCAKINIFTNRRSNCHFISLLDVRPTLKGKNLLLKEQILFLQSRPHSKRASRKSQVVPPL